jgi:hypothetical protein
VVQLPPIELTTPQRGVAILALGHSSIQLASRSSPAFAAIAR